MRAINSTQILDDLLNGSNKLTVLHFANANNPACKQTRRVLEELEEKYKAKVDFYDLDAVRLYDTMLRFQVSAIPSVVILAPDLYGSSVMIKKACITAGSINKDNMIGLISEYGSWSLK